MDCEGLRQVLGGRGAVSGPVRRPALVRGPEAVVFKRDFLAGLEAGGPLVLCNHEWGERELGRLQALLESRRPGPEDGRGWLWIPTGGSSGELRFARHDPDTIQAAVEGFCAHFGLSCVNALGVLPLHHVSGFMPWMRCAISGGRHLDWEWRQLEQGKLPELPDGDWVLSLVPTQLRRLLRQAHGAGFLRRFRVVFLGGAPAGAELLDEARSVGLRLSASYGMTETAAMVAAQRPEEFLAGLPGVGRALPHARLRITEEGCIAVQALSLMRGYAGLPESPREHETEDLGCLLEDGTLQVKGRRDEVILTGGEKVSPLELEEALRAAGWEGDLAVLGVPDRDWGEAVVVCVPKLPSEQKLSEINQHLSDLLEPRKRPKRWCVVEPWPRNAQGKLRRADLLAAIGLRKAGLA